jgi:hypothetical protein
VIEVIHNKWAYTALNYQMSCLKCVAYRWFFSVNFPVITKGWRFNWNVPNNGLLPSIRLFCITKHVFNIQLLKNGTWLI